MPAAARFWPFFVDLTHPTATPPTRQMMCNLLLNEGDRVTVRNVSVPVAQFAKFQPQSVDFLDISNPKAVLENALRTFACLTEGDMIAIPYNNRVYEICVREVRPKHASKAVSIIECDMQVQEGGFNRRCFYILIACCSRVCSSISTRPWAMWSPPSPLASLPPLPPPPLSAALRR